MKNRHPLITPGIGRRRLLQGAALGGLALGLPAGLLAQAAATSRPLRGNLHLVTGAGCNVLVAVGPDGLLVVDGGLQAYSDTLLEEIDRLGQGRPVQILFNTNWRPEHCGLNYTLGPAGVRIIAHENTRLWQNNDFSVDWEGRHYAPMPREAQANSTFYKTGSLAFGDETVDYGFISQCHTDGDIYVYFREANVLAAGDMLAAGAYPVLDYVTGGWVTGARTCTDALLELADAGTLLVPAAGAVQDRAALEVQKQMLDLAYDKVAEAYRNGRSLEQFMATDPMADFNARYGDPDLFVRLLYRSTWYHVTSRAVPGII